MTRRWGNSPCCRCGRQLDNAYHSISLQCGFPFRQRSDCQSNEVCHDQRQSIQKRFFHAILRCLGPKEDVHVMHEQHEGVYDNHSRSQSLFKKLTTMGLLLTNHAKGHPEVCQAVWQMPTIQQCVKATAKGAQSMTSPWPFAQWGINLVGPLPLGKR